MNDYLRELLACRSAADFHKVHRKAGDVFTPLEIAWLLDRDFALPQPTQDFLAGLTERGYFDPGEPERYLRAALGPGATLYSDPDHEPHGKRLLVAFCSYGHRLLMPVPSFLQMLPSERFDVLMLADHRRSHFLLGIPGLAPDLPGLVRWIEGNADLKRYGDMLCYGVSAGGFTALRAAHLLGAPRGIAMSGRFHGHVARLLGNWRGWSGFDLLCACVEPRADYVAVYSEGSEPDRLDADRLARIVPLTHVMMTGTADHTPFRHLESGRLRAFFARLLDFPVEAAFDDAAEGLSSWRSTPSPAQPAR